MDFQWALSNKQLLNQQTGQSEMLTSDPQSR